MGAVESLRGYCLAFFVLLYVLAEYLSSITGIEPTTQKQICLIPFIIFTFMSKCKMNNTAFILRIIISILILLVLNFVFCEPHTFSMRLLFNIIFLYFVSYKEIPLKSLVTVFTFVKISAILFAASVFYLYLSYGFYVRTEALIDKSLASGVLALCFMVCWIDVILDRKRIINVLIIAVILYIDIFIIVSKTSIFSFLFFIVITFFYMKKEDRRIYMRISKYILGIACIIIFIFPDIALSDDLKETINTIIGQDVYELSKVRVDNTFSVRGYLIEYSINQLFLNHPFIGIGIGNFAYYNQSFYSDIGETESSALAIITEGGVYYAVVMIVFYYTLIKKGIKRIRERLGYEECIAVGLPIVYFILCIGNDFMDSLYWIMMGISYSILYKKENLFERTITNKK